MPTKARLEEILQLWGKEYGFDDGMGAKANIITKPISGDSNFYTIRRTVADDVEEAVSKMAARKYVYDWVLRAEYMFPYYWPRNQRIDILESVYQVAVTDAQYPRYLKCGRELVNMFLEARGVR